MKKKLTFTKKKTIRLHRKMWYWLAKNPTKNKHHWPGWKDIKKRVISHCFVCQYVVDKGNGIWDCAFCPFLWNKERTCEGTSSPYRKWLSTDITQTEKRTYYALKVATLKTKRLPE